MYTGLAFRRQDDIVRSMDFNTGISSTYPRHCYLLYYHLHHNKRGKLRNENLINPPKWFIISIQFMNLNFVYSFVKASGLRMFGGYLWRGIKELLCLFLQWMLDTWCVGLRMEYCVSFTSSFHKRNNLTFLAEITIN